MCKKACVREMVGLSVGCIYTGGLIGREIQHQKTLLWKVEQTLCSSLISS